MSSVLSISSSCLCKQGRFLCDCAKALVHSDIGLVKQNFDRKIVNIFLPINFNICLGCLKEPSH